MCSACLRNTKRQTKPSFYLGTCYSEMSRRVKTFDPLRPNYYNMEICSKKEFIDRFLIDEMFLNLYKNWQDNNFERKFAPSIDRRNNTIGYKILNLQFIRQGENSVKDILVKVFDEFGNKFNSVKEAATQYETTGSIISRCCRRGRKHRGVKFYYA